MNFNNAFEVSLPPNEAWPFLMDVERVIPCMPGAELLQIIDDRTFKGKISVKLGPVLLAFTCDAIFADVDPVRHSAQINTQGVDAKGRGGVKSSIHFHLEPSGGGSKVMIDTDLSMSGAVAQYGRGAAMMQSVANQLISQFSTNLETSIAANRRASIAPPSGTPQAHADSAANVPSSSTAPRPAAKPIGGFALLYGALVRAIRNFFGRKPST
jgi:carbon monoxide dehydrogenase subunit G